MSSEFIIILSVLHRVSRTAYKPGGGDSTERELTLTSKFKEGGGGKLKDSNEAFFCGWHISFLI